MTLFIESVLNGLVLFVGPLMLVAAMGGALTLLQRLRDVVLEHRRV